jgi:hypothetical protein
MGLAYYASKVLVKEQIAKVGRRQSLARPHPLSPLPFCERGNCLFQCAVLKVSSPLAGQVVKKESRLR